MSSTISTMPEWRSLTAEPDSELRAEGMLALAGRLAARGHEAEASEIYSSLLSEHDSALDSQRQRAAERLEALSGGGNLGTRAEHFLSHFVQQSTDPAALFAMGVAGGVFRVARLGALARLSAGPSSYFTRGFGARALASVAGFGAESLAFPFAARLAQASMGRSQDWSLPTLGREWGASLLTLGALRGSGAAMGLAARRWAAQGTVSTQLLSQSSMLGGIWLAQNIEGRLGWRREEGAGASFATALATLLHFNVSARVSRDAFGARFANWENHLDLQAESLTHRPPVGTRAAWLTSEPLYATAYPIAIQGEGESGPKLSPVPSEPRQIPTSFPPTIYRNYRFPSGKGEIRPPLIEYSKEWRDWWRQAAPRLRAANSELTHEANSADCLPLREANRLWRMQIEDFARLVGAEFSVHPPKRLLEAMRPGFLKRDPSLLQYAETLAGEGTEIYELSFPYSSVQFGEANVNGDYANLHSIMRDIAVGFGNHVHLANQGGGQTQIRLPSLELWDALNRAQFGENTHRMVAVKGVISRDRMMAFREKQRAPLGLSKQASYIKDIQGLAHSFFFTLHDAFHASVASSLPSSIARTTGRLYRISKAGLPASDLKEELLDRFSDLDPGTEYKSSSRPNEFWDFTLNHFWKSFVVDANRGDFIGPRLEQYPTFLLRYQSLVRKAALRHPEDAPSLNYIEALLQENSKRLGSLLLEVLRK